jgi:hypothetical protein
MKVRYRARALADIEGIYRYLAPRSQVGAHNVLRAIYAQSSARQPCAISRYRCGKVEGAGVHLSTKTANGAKSSSTSITNNR